MNLMIRKKILNIYFNTHEKPEYHEINTGVPVFFPFTLLPYQKDNLLNLLLFP